MSDAGIPGYQLEVTVVGCRELRDSSTFLHDQDPYIRLEYANFTVRTQVCKRKAKNPTFNQTFKLTLVERCREIGVAVWNKNTIGKDYLIGTARVPLEKLLREGLDDEWWPLLHEESPAGQIKLVMKKVAVQGDKMNNWGYITPLPTDLHPPAEAVPYMAYPPPFYPVMSLSLSPSSPQPALFSSTVDRSVSYIGGQTMLPEEPMLIPPTNSFNSFTPSAPSVPDRSFNYNQPSHLAPTSEPSSSSPPSTDFRNQLLPLSPSSHLSPSYQEDRVGNGERQAFGEERIRWRVVESFDASRDQRIVERSLPHVSRDESPAKNLRQRNSQHEVESFNPSPDQRIVQRTLPHGSRDESPANSFRQRNSRLEVESFDPSHDQRIVEGTLAHGSRDESPAKNLRQRNSQHEVESFNASPDQRIVQRTLPHGSRDESPANSFRQRNSRLEVESFNPSYDQRIVQRTLPHGSRDESPANSFRQRNSRLEVESFDPSYDQRIVEGTSPHGSRDEKPAKKLRQRNSQHATIANASNSTTESANSSPKTSASLSFKKKLCLLVLCFFFGIYWKVTNRFSITFWNGT